MADEADQLPEEELLGQMKLVLVGTIHLCVPIAFIPVRSYLLDTILPQAR